MHTFLLSKFNCNKNYFPSLFCRNQKRKIQLVRKQEYIARSRELNKNISKQTGGSNAPCPYNTTTRCPCKIIARCPCNNNAQCYPGNSVRLFPSGNTRLYECSTILERGMNSPTDTFNFLKLPDVCRADGRRTHQPQDVTKELCSELNSSNQSEWSPTNNSKLL